MEPDAMILVFWMLSFKPAFWLSSFTFIRRLFNSSSLLRLGWCHLQQSQIVDFSPCNLDSSLCFLHPGISHFPGLGCCYLGISCTNFTVGISRMYVCMGPSSVSAPTAFPEGTVPQWDHRPGPARWSLSRLTWTPHLPAFVLLCQQAGFWCHASLWGSLQALRSHRAEFLPC